MENLKKKRIELQQTIQRLTQQLQAMQNQTNQLALNLAQQQGRLAQINELIDENKKEPINVEKVAESKEKK